MKDKEECIIRIIIDFFKNLKKAFYEVLDGTKAECSIPLDTLELVARSLWDDIVRYYEEKRSDVTLEEKQKSTQLTK